MALASGRAIRLEDLPEKVRSPRESAVQDLLAFPEEGIELEYVNGAVSYFLPHGLTQQCLHCTPWLCPMDGSLFTPIFAPGVYKLYVFNTWSSRGGDYNLSIGTGEEGETCEAISHTLDIYQGIVNDEVMVMPHCVEAGESDFLGCPVAPY